MQEFGFQVVANLQYLETSVEQGGLKMGDKCGYQIALMSLAV